MLFIGLFVVELVILYLLTRNIHALFFKLFYQVSRNKNAATYLLAFLFLPGTFLHELAHWLAAIVLFVPVGSMTLIPKMNEGGSLRLGSVSIAKTDIIRRFIIGAAPIVMGISIILTMVYFAFKEHIFADLLMIFLLGYMVFEIGNTMLSSKKDMEGALSLILTLLVACVVVYFLGFRTPISGAIEFFSNSVVVDIFRRGTLYLLIPIFIDLFFVLILRMTHACKW